MKSILLILRDKAKTATPGDIVPLTFNPGDKITIRATVTGQKQRHVNFVLDDVPRDMVRSFTMPAAPLAIATKKSAA